MHIINELVTFDYKNEHDLEHDLEHKRLFSTPKIYDANGDLNKRWYIYFSYRDPDTGKMKRMKNIYGKVNGHKTKEARYSLLRLYKKRLLKLLQEGYNPFVDNTAHFRAQQKAKAEQGSVKVDNENSNEKVTPPLKNEVSGKTPESSTTINSALEHAIGLKKNLVSSRTMVDYRNRCKLFLDWIEKNHAEIKTIDQVSKKVVAEFLNDIQLRTSPRNRNNYRTCLSAVFQIMEDNEIIPKNFIKNIGALKSKPQRNKSFTQKEEKAIFSFLEERDPILLLFIKFISYNFLRPIEVCRLRVRDIDLDESILRIRVKNKPLKTKIIPKILMRELGLLKGLDGDLLVFTPQKIGGEWKAELSPRRDYFSKRFKDIVKDHFGLDKNYGLYSFRHTFITKLYRALVKDSSPFAAKSALMQITGHTTMKALEKYLRDIDAELPDDYSKLLNGDI